MRAERRGRGGVCGVQSAPWAERPGATQRGLGRAALAARGPRPRRGPRHPGRRAQGPWGALRGARGAGPAPIATPRAAGKAVAVGAGPATPAALGTCRPGLVPAAHAQFIFNHLRSP